MSSLFHADGGSHSKYHRHIQQAWAWLSDGRIDHAAQGFNIVLTSEPDHPDALHGLGAVAYVCGEIDQAVGLLRRALTQEPAHVDLYYDLGCVLATAKRHAEAIECLYQAAKINEHDIRVWRDLANLLRLEQRWLESEQVARHVLSLDNNDVSANFCLGCALVERGVVVEGEHVLNRAMLLQPDSLEISEALAYALLQQGRMNDAWHCLSEKMDWKNPQSIFRMTSFLMAAGHHRERAQPSETPLVTAKNVGVSMPDPTWASVEPVAWLREQDTVSAAMVDQDDIRADQNRAAQAVRESLAHHGGHLQAVYSLVDALCLQGEFFIAQCCLEQLAVQRPECIDQIDLIRRMGCAVLEQGRAVDAGVWFEQSVRRDPDCAVTRYSLARISMYGGHYRLAIQQVSHAIRLDPHYVDAWILMMRALSMLGEQQHLVRQIMQYVSGLLEGQPELAYRSGQCLEMLHEFGEAGKIFVSVLQRDAGHVSCYVHLSSVLMSLEQFKTAGNILEEGLSITHRHLALVQAKARFLMTMGLYDDAIDNWQHVHARLPLNAVLLSNMLTTLMHLKRYEEAERVYFKILGLSDPGIAQLICFDFAQSHADWDNAEHLAPFALELLGCDVSGLFVPPKLPLRLLASGQILRQDFAAVASSAHQQRVLGRVGRALQANFSALVKAPHLRVGLLISDLSLSQLGPIFLNALCQRQDQTRYVLFAYCCDGDVPRCEMTGLQQCLDVKTLSKREIAERIASDGIHVLIDCTAFPETHRVSVLDYRPAPVQIAWFSSADVLPRPVYSNVMETTRIAMLTDEEYVAAVMPSLICHDFPAVVVSMPPCLHRGYVTLGCYVEPAMLNRSTISMWACILRAVSTAKLSLQHVGYEVPLVRRNLINLFERFGVKADRIDFVSATMSLEEMLSSYQNIDIVLTVLPIQPSLEMVHALWMGVPVLSLVDEFATGLNVDNPISLLPLDTSKLMGYGADDYIRKAVMLCEDAASLIGWRHALRAAVERSSLCDRTTFAHKFEMAMMMAWQTACPDYPLDVWHPKQLFSLKHTGQICLSLTAKDHASIVLECGGSYEPEWQDLPYWLPTAVLGSSTVLDMGDDPGWWAIPLAYQIGTTGQLIHFSTLATSLECVRVSADAQQLSQIKAALLPTDLSALAQALASVGKVSFLRMGLARTYGDEAWSMLLSSTRPDVICLSVCDQVSVDLQRAQWLASQGYHLFQWVPSLRILVPMAEVDAYSLNVFALSDAGLAHWREANLCVTDIPGLDSLPIVDIDSHYRQMPYGRMFDILAIEGPLAWQDIYVLALGLHTIFTDEHVPLAQRWSALNFAGQIMSQLLQDAPSIPRYLSAARIALDLGQRERSMVLLQALINDFESGSIRLNEPFLAPDGVWEHVAPHEGKESQWLLAAVLDTWSWWSDFAGVCAPKGRLALISLALEQGYEMPRLSQRAKSMRYSA